MWKEQLKVSNVPTMRTDIKPIPQPDNKRECLEELKSHEQKLKDKEKELQGKYDTNRKELLFSSSFYLSPEVDEEFACKILEELDILRGLNWNHLENTTRQSTKSIIEHKGKKYRIYAGSWVNNDNGLSWFN